MKKLIVILMTVVSFNLFSSDLLSSYFATSTFQIITNNSAHDLEFGTELIFKVKSFNMLRGELSLIAQVADGVTGEIIFNSATAVQCQVPGDIMIVYPNYNARIMPGELYCTFKTQNLVEKGGYILVWSLYSKDEMSGMSQLVERGSSPLVNLL